MDDNQTKQINMVESTDCLEAVGVLRRWKNFMFLVMALCLLLLQACFWLVDAGYVGAKAKSEAVQVSLPGMGQQPVPKVTPPAEDIVVPLGDSKAGQQVEESIEIEKAAKAAIEPTGTEVEVSQPEQAVTGFGIKKQHVIWIVRFCNFVLIVAAALYCLTMLFGLKISLVGRLGGINHICRAFFLSLVIFVLLLPWQSCFGSIIVGVMYTPDELMRSCATKADSISRIALHYLRFSGYWLIVFLLLILSQLRSFRWTKTILRRLEII